MEAFATAFASLMAGLLSLVEKNKSSIAALIAYMAGKSAMAKQIKTQQAEQDAALAKDYTKNRDTDRSPDDTVSRVQDGSF